MRIKFLALAMSFTVLPALAQTPLRGTPDDTFKFVPRQEIAKRSDDAVAGRGLCLRLHE